MTKINHERDDALFCKCQGKLIYHLTAEMQVAVGFVAIKDVTYCKKYPQEGELHAAAEAAYGRSLAHLDLYLGRKPVLCTTLK